MLRAAFRRLLALDDPPERTALAFSVGVFIAFSPFLGLHTLLATVLAFAFRFNKVAIYAGTFVNNPFLTLVPLVALSYALGALVMGRPVELPDEGLALLREPHVLAADYWREVDDVRRAMAHDAGRWRRLRATLNLRSLRRPTRAVQTG